MKNAYIKIITLSIIITSLFFYSCDTINNALGLDEEEAIVSSETYEITPFNTVEVLVENIVIGSSEIYGRIGGYDVTLFNFDEKLVFIVPKMPEGPTDLEFDLNDASYSLSFNVKPVDKITNPEEYMEAFIEDQNTLVENNALLIDTFIPEDKKDEYQDEITRIDQLFIDVQNMLQSSTEEEKLEAAQFIAANKDAINLLQSSVNDYIIAVNELYTSKTRSVYDTESKFDAAYAKFVLARINLISQAKKIIVWTAAGSLAGSWLPVLGNGIGAAIGAGIGIGNFFLALQADNIATDRLTEFEAIVEDITLDSKNANIIYNNDQKSTLRVSGKYSNLNSTYKNSQMPKIQEFVSYLRIFRDLFNSINEYIPDIISFKPKVIEELNSVKNSTKQVNGNYISISNISNPNVTYSYEIVDGEYYITFKTDQETDQDFSFDIDYAYNGFSEKRTSENASLSISDATLIGKWNVYYNEGVTYGEWSYYYFEDCPEIISYAYKIHYQTLEFTETTLESNHRESSKDYTYYGLDYMLCSYDSFTINEETVNDDEILLYYIEGNVIKASDGNVVTNFPILELTANTLKMGYYEDGVLKEIHLERISK